MGLIRSVLLKKRVEEFSLNFDVMFCKFLSTIKCGHDLARQLVPLIKNQSFQV